MDRVVAENQKREVSQQPQEGIIPQGGSVSERQYLRDLAEEKTETIEKLKGSNRSVVVVLRRKLFKNDGSCDISALWKQNHSL